ncbi:hypothetical protein M434DRAFT_397947 [Hypoxylon sp. CO27-5]|nr:hypothetical protein M434DRAFT_397947 [Hypoxylon sp. CO27-5]
MARHVPTLEQDSIIDGILSMTATDLDFIYLIPQFIYGWTVALLVCGIFMMWDDALAIFIAFVYIYLVLAGGCFLFALNPVAFLSVAVLICLWRYR